MITFEIGSTYSTRSIVDADSFFKLTVEKRTRQTLTDKTGRLYRIKVVDGVEEVSMGRYSMAPSFKANRKEITS